MHQRYSIYRLFFLLSAVSVLSCNQAAPPVATATATETITSAEVVKADTPIEKAKEAPPPKVAPLTDNGTFIFPDDNGGKLLAKIVTPIPPPSLSATTPLTQRERVLPAFLDSPSPAPGDATNSPPTLRLPEAVAVVPKPLPERVPMDFAPALPQIPQRSTFLTGPLTREQGRDVAQPADLPFLTQQPIPDRASLADPTTEFTAQSVISLVLPLRTETTGFIRINLPDPFEHSEAARPRTLLPENPNRALGNPPPPKP